MRGRFPIKGTPMGYRIGLDGVLKHGTKGSKATTPIANCTDVTLDLTAITADTTSRSSVDWTSEKSILKTASLTFKMLNHSDDADGAIAAIKSAFMGDDAIALHPTDSTGGEGLNADWNITGFKRDETMLQVQAFDVTATPNNEDREPVWEA